MHTRFFLTKTKQKPTKTFKEIKNSMCRKQNCNSPLIRVCHANLEVARNLQNVLDGAIVCLLIRDNYDKGDAVEGLRTHLVSFEGGVKQRADVE